MASASSNQGCSGMLTADYWTTHRRRKKKYTGGSAGEGSPPPSLSLSLSRPGLVGVAPGRGVIMCPPVSVCHHVSTIGHLFPPTTSEYLFGVLGSSFQISGFGFGVWGSEFHFFHVGVNG